MINGVIERSNVKFGTIDKTLRKSFFFILIEFFPLSLPLFKKENVAEWLDTWLKDIVALDKKPSTHTNYKTIAEMHLKPDLGRIRLDKLTRGDVQRLISKKARTDLAARTVRLIHRVLHCALNRAVKLKMIAINPASDLVLPRIEHTAMATVSPEQVFQLQ